MAISFPLGPVSAWFSNQAVTAAKIQANITDAINQLAASLAALAGGGPVASGVVTVHVGTGGTPASATVTFPTGRFTGTPVVLTTPQTSLPGSLVTGTGYLGASSTGCTIWANRTTAGDVPVAWFAALTS